MRHKHRGHGVRLPQDVVGHRLRVPQSQCRTRRDGGPGILSGNEAMAADLLDRLLHPYHVLNIRGRS